MFTGLIEHVSVLRANQASPTGRRLIVPLGILAEGVRPGDSIAVNGVCLTVSRLQGPDAVFDVMAETAGVTTLARLGPAARVNLERALPADGRFGGHLVQGHVDGVGIVDRIDPSPAGHVLWFRASAELLGMMIPRGSIAVDGVSLTITAMKTERFGVSLIPTTLAETNLSDRRVGDPVNLETDLIGKWIRNYLDQRLAGGPSDALTLEKLRAKGFA